MACRLSILADPYVPEDDQFRAIFVHIPKSAGTSIRRALYGRKSFHVPLSRYFAYDAERAHGYFKFCFVRNPWSRLDSAFHYLWARRNDGAAYRDYRWAHEVLSEVSGFKSFVYRLGADKTFLRRVKGYLHFRDQLDWVSRGAGSDEPAVDYIGRFETIEHDFEEIAVKLDIEQPLPMDRVRVGKKDYRSSFDDRMAEIVGSVYAKDCLAFDYSFE